MPFVVDNSVVAAWFFPGQATDYTDSVLDRLKTDTAHVPALWVLEFSNVLRKAIMGRKLAKRRARSVKPTEVRRIEAAVLEHEALFLEKWHEHNHG